MDGLPSITLEIKDYLSTQKPDVFCIAETKLREEIHLNFQKEGYKVWRRDKKRKGGGGVLIMVQEDIFVEGVQYGDDMAKVIRITIQTNGRERRKVIVTYVPPKTNTGKLEEYKAMQKVVLKCLGDVMRKDRKVLLAGDFNCKGVNWKEMEGSGNAGSWSENMLQLAIENTLDQ